MVERESTHVVLRQQDTNFVASRRRTLVAIGFVVVPRLAFRLHHTVRLNHHFFCRLRVVVVALIGRQMNAGRIVDLALGESEWVYIVTLCGILYAHSYRICRLSKTHLKWQAQADVPQTTRLPEYLLRPPNQVRPFVSPWDLSDHVWPSSTSTSSSWSNLSTRPGDDVLRQRGSKCLRSSPWIEARVSAIRLFASISEAFLMLSSGTSSAFTIKWIAFDWL